MFHLCSPPTRTGSHRSSAPSGATTGFPRTHTGSQPCSHHGASHSAYRSRTMPPPNISPSTFPVFSAGVALKTFPLDDEPPPTSLLAMSRRKATSSTCCNLADFAPAPSTVTMQLASMCRDVKPLATSSTTNGIPPGCSTKPIPWTKTVLECFYTALLGVPARNTFRVEKQSAI